MSGSPVVLPTPPIPGASTVKYGYPQFGPSHEQFMTTADPGSKSSGLVDKWKYINVFRLFGKHAHYMNEYRWFNEFRAERRPQHDKRTRGAVTRTGEFKVFRQGNMCWRAERVQVEMKLELAYDELQMYEMWRINLSQEAWYSFFTGYGGVMVDAGIDLPAAGGAAVAARATTAAAATGAAPSTAALRLGAASRALGLVGWGYLWFQIGTGAVVVISGGAKNAAGEKLSTGWEFVRTFWDSAITEDIVEEWEAVEAPHPCTDAECEVAETALVIPGAQTPIGSGIGWRSAKFLAGGGVVIAIIIGALFTFPKGGTPNPTPTPTPTAAVATATPTASATEVSAATPFDFGTPTPPASAFGTPAAYDTAPGPGQVLVFQLDYVDFLADGLTTIPAHEPFCSYEHVHGTEITSLLPGPDGEYLKRTEHLGECGYGPPNFFLIDDPR